MLALQDLLVFAESDVILGVVRARHVRQAGYGHNRDGVDWITQKLNLIIIRKTSLGKRWLACALAHKACRDDRSVLYRRVPRLFDALAFARGDGRPGDT
jgi:DNA replication protein DnaC